MAANSEDANKAAPSISQNTNCNSCSRQVKSEVKCKVCYECYHPSCAVRIKGIKVVGFNELICPACDEKCANESDQTEAANTQKQLQKENELLNMLLLQMMETQDSLKNLIFLLEDKMSVLIQNTRNQEVSTEKVLTKNISYAQKTANKRIVKSQTSPEIPSMQIKQAPSTFSNIASHQERAATTFKEPQENCKADNDQGTQGGVNPENQNGDEEEKWQVVPTRENRQKRRRPEFKIATGNTVKSTKIMGAPTRKWIYVGHVTGKDVKEDDMKEYMQDIDGNENILVKKLNNKGNNSAFSIGLPENLVDQVFNPNYWPKGVFLREFDFKRAFLFKRQPVSLNVNQQKPTENQEV